MCCLHRLHTGVQKSRILQIRLCFYVIGTTVAIAGTIKYVVNTLLGPLIAGDTDMRMHPVPDTTRSPTSTVCTTESTIMGTSFGKVSVGCQGTKAMVFRPRKATNTWDLALD